MSNDTLGRTAYAAYGKTTDNKNYQGNEMPAFDDLPENIKTAWENAAAAVAAAVGRADAPNGDGTDQPQDEGTAVS